MYAVIFVIAIVVVFTLLDKARILKFLFRSGPAKEEKLPYKKKDYLLSVAEKSFYQVLKQVADKNDVLIFAKVRLEDLLWLPGNIERKERFGLRNRIKSRHIDFVLCDRENIKPLLAIELDDSSHDRQDRVDRDYSIDNILKDAGLPILHQKVQYSYNPQELEDKISGLLKF